MYEETIAFLLNPPSRLKAVGAFLMRGSVTLIILGMTLRINLIVADIIQGIAKVNVGDVTLTSLYPGFPTWFIPESTLGFIFCTTVFALGLYAQIWTKQFERIYW